MSIDEELKILENKVTTLRRDYEHYFIGQRPREPVQLRSEVQKEILRHTNVPIQNTAARFRFNSINSRFQAFKRRWDATLRQIEAGTYKRHVFKAELHSRQRAAANQPAAASSGPPESSDSLFVAYRDAALACGQNVKGLTPEKLRSVVASQEAKLREKLGCERVDFRVTVENGKVKLKASPT